MFKIILNFQENKFEIKINKVETSYEIFALPMEKIIKKTIFPSKKVRV